MRLHQILLSVIFFDLFRRPLCVMLNNSYIIIIFIIRGIAYLCDHSLGNHIWWIILCASGKTWWWKNRVYNIVALVTFLGIDSLEEGLDRFLLRWSHVFAELQISGGINLLQFLLLLLLDIIFHLLKTFAITAATALFLISPLLNLRVTFKWIIALVMHDHEFWI